MVNSPQDKAFCDRVWEYALPFSDGERPTSRMILDVNYQFVFLVLHLRKHFLNQGVGFRQFMDVAVWAHGAALDREQVGEMLRETGAEAFADVCMTLCDRWFYGASADTVDEAFFEQATEKIFGNGVFGFHDADNRSSRLLNRVKASGKIGSIWKHLFPAYRDFYYVPYYSFVQGRPYLLPAAWAYRFYRMLRYGKTGEARQYAQDVLHSDRQMTEREQFLHRWGC